QGGFQRNPQMQGGYGPQQMHQPMNQSTHQQRFQNQRMNAGQFGNMNDMDEQFMFWITREPVIPMSQDKSIQRQTMFDPMQFQHLPQNYRAYVWLLPERAKGIGWSNPYKG
ncbi:MAG: hypothetical protein ACOCZ8_00145, partial [Bacteroidota bacterium]